MKDNVEKLSEDDVINVTEWKNQAVYNVLERARYVCEVMELGKSVSGKGNYQFVVELLVDNTKKLTKYFVYADGDKKPHKQVYFWNNFLYCIGMRDSRSNVDFLVKNILHKKCLVDISKVPDDPPTDAQGNPRWKNEITGFSQIEEQTAPTTDVPPETEEKPKDDEI